MAKIILVTGNTGKTVFSYFLANEFCKLKKKVVVVSPDINLCPAFSLFFENKCERSIGKVLEKPNITQAEVFAQMYFPKNDFAYLGYAPNENFISYPELVMSNCKRFFALLKACTDVIIVDTQKSVGTLERSLDFDEIYNINLCSADRRGIAYRNSNQLLVKQTIEVLLENNKYCNVSEIIPTYKHTPYILPYVKQLGEVYTTAKISDIKGSKKYIKAIKNIIRSEIYVR